MKHIVTLSLFLLAFTCGAQVKFSELPMAPTINSSTKFVGLNTVSTTNTVYRYNIADMITYFNAHGGGTLTSITGNNGVIATPSPITGTGVLSVDSTKYATRPRVQKGIDSLGVALTTLANGKILVGNGSNIATAVNTSGDARISNTGVIVIDSSIYATRPRVQKGIDSLGALISTGAVYQYTTATTFTGTVTVTSSNSARSVKFFITAQAGNLLIQNFAGSLTDGQFFTLAIAEGGGGPYVLTWGTQFTGSVSTTLPAATIPGSTIYCGFIYRSSGPKIHLVAYSED